MSSFPISDFQRNYLYTEQTITEYKKLMHLLSASI